MSQEHAVSGIDTASSRQVLPAIGRHISSGFENTVPEKGLDTITSSLIHKVKLQHIPGPEVEVKKRAGRLLKDRLTLFLFEEDEVFKIVQKSRGKGGFPRIFRQIIAAMPSARDSLPITFDACILEEDENDPDRNSRLLTLVPDEDSRSILLENRADALKPFPHVALDPSTPGLLIAQINPSQKANRIAQELLHMTEDILDGGPVAGTFSQLTTITQSMRSQ